MRKKKQNPHPPPPSSTASAATSTSTSTPAAADLKPLIHDHSLFFDRLIELIPARFYLPSDDADSKPWYQGLSKAAKAAANLQTRQNLKNARRHRLDPANSSATTLDLLKQSLQPQTATTNNGSKTERDAKNEEDGIEPVGKLDGDGDDDRSVTFEELRQRLRRRIEELRANRGNGEKAKDGRRGRRDENHQNKRKRSDGNQEKIDNAGKLAKSDGEIEKEVAEATKGIEFGKVRMGLGVEADSAGRKKKRRRKLSKEEELERARRLEEAKKDPEKGELVARKHSWKAAAERAMGVKVHDDPRLLRQSIQKEKKRHEKNAEKWKERAESTEKSKEAKQQRRAGNIAERIHQKKMRKIAKREKKLMRPGFEGRKEGYINVE